MKKVTDDQEMKLVTTYPTNFESFEKSKYSCSELNKLLMYDDKKYDEIENSLNYVLSNTKNSLDKAKLSLFFRE